MLFPANVMSNHKLSNTAKIPVELLRTVDVLLLSGKTTFLPIIFGFSCKARKRQFTAQYEQVNCL